MKGAVIVIYELKHFDTAIIKFSLEYDSLKGTICEVVWSDESRKALYPIGLEANPKSVLSWLRSRTVPKNRSYVESLLASMNLADNDLIGIINICKGLSLNDSYWVVEDGFNGKFDDYNLYDHEFLKALSLIAYTGYGSVKAKGFTSSPEFTTNGMLRKGWRKIKDKIYLYKGGTEGAANSGKEPYSEYYAAQLAHAMGLKHIDYSLASWKKSICSVCEIFTSKDVSYVPIWKFGDFPTVVDVANYLKTLGDDYYNDFVDMMIFDALIYNTDRHQGNFGLLIDSRTNKLISLAPIFDNGLGLFPYAMDNDLENLSAYAKTRTSAFDVSFDAIAKEYISDRQKAQLRKILNFKFVSNKTYHLPAKRVKVLERFIKNRAVELLNM